MAEFTLKAPIQKVDLEEMNLYLIKLHYYLQWAMLHMDDTNFTEAYNHKQDEICQYCQRKQRKLHLRGNRKHPYSD